MPVRAQCGQDNPEAARFRNECAAPLTAEAPTAREERKVVTILFADLVGFTGRAERLDESVARWLTRFPPLLSFARDRWGAITAYLQVVLGAMLRARASRAANDGFRSRNSRLDRQRKHFFSRYFERRERRDSNPRPPA
jgi:hypothetical protein